VTSRRPEVEKVARVLAQRRELGATELVFEETPRTGVISTLEAFALRPRSGRPESGTAPDPAARLPGPSGYLEPSGHPRPEPSGHPEPDPSGYDELRALAGTCTKCRLSEGRTQVVFSDGHPNARLLVIGEAPGANEDRTGLPFVGPAGKLLDLLLASVGLSRETSVHICNVIKCRPPENRNPRPDEIEACTPFLRRQIELVRPEVILGVGAFAAQFLTGTDKGMGKLRGEVYSYEGTPVVVTYHPAALLRNQGWIRPTWDDLQLVRRLLDSETARDPS